MANNQTGLSRHGLIHPHHQNRSSGQEDTVFNENAIWLAVIPVLTSFENVFVLICVGRHRALRKLTNYFVCSLAVADLCVATISMPVLIKLTGTDYKWLAPPYLCDVWLSLNVMACAASVFNLTAISIDRYIAVTRPILYSFHKHSMAAYMTMAIPWILSVALGALGLLVPDELTKEGACPLHPSSLIFIASIGGFYIPCALILFLNWRIYRTIHKRALALRAMKSYCHHTKVRFLGFVQGGLPANPTPGHQNKQESCQNIGGKALCSGAGGTNGYILSSVNKAEEINLNIPALGGQGNNDFFLHKLKENSADMLAVDTTILMVKESNVDLFDRKSEDSITSLATRSPCCSIRSSVGKVKGINANTSRNEDFAVNEHKTKENKVDILFTGDTRVPMANRRGVDLFAPKHENKMTNPLGKEAETSNSKPIFTNAEARKTSVSIPNNTLTALYSNEPRSSTILERVGSVLMSFNPMVRLSIPTHDEETENSSLEECTPIDEEDEPKPESEMTRAETKWTSSISEGRHSRASTPREKKVLISLLRVLGVFLVCWLPINTIVVFEGICQSYRSNLPFCNIDRVYFTIATWMAYTNSLFNPILFAFSHPEFQKAIVKMFCGPSVDLHRSSVTSRASSIFHQRSRDFSLPSSVRSLEA